MLFVEKLGPTPARLKFVLPCAENLDLPIRLPCDRMQASRLWGQTPRIPPFTTEDTEVHRGRAFLPITASGRLVRRRILNSTSSRRRRHISCGTSRPRASPVRDPRSRRVLSQLVFL